ncbi:MAG: hypothetical protein COA33_010640 [Fluviicola sp.]|nr:hypothetical protein [Fluviicola sp.]
MANYLKFFFLSLVLFSIASCGTSNNVQSNRLIQKRKYTKGYRLNKSSSFKKEQKKEDLSESYEQEDLQASESAPKYVSSKQEKEVSLKNQEQAYESDNKIPKTKAQKLLDLKKKVKSFYAFNEKEKDERKKEDVEEKSVVNEPVSKQENSEDDNSKYSASAIVGFVLAILAALCLITFFLSFFWVLPISSWVIILLLSIFTFLFGIGAVVFSIVGLKKTSRGQLKGKAFALTGLIMGGSILIISLFSLFIFLVFSLLFF